MFSYISFANSTKIYLAYIIFRTNKKIMSIYNLLFSNFRPLHDFFYFVSIIVIIPPVLLLIKTNFSKHKSLPNLVAVFAQQCIRRHLSDLLKMLLLLIIRSVYNIKWLLVWYSISLPSMNNTIQPIIEYIIPKIM